LFLIVRYLLDILRFFFAAVEKGDMKISGFFPEWAGPTYKITRFLILVFALVIAYPYIPGSRSRAFEGISIFLGVLFSLGSTTIIANMVAGVILTYMRGFRVGDVVKIGDTTGKVTAVSLLVTRLRTPKNLEITIPNSMLMSSQVINYSFAAGEGRLILPTSITIGYDAPWRQVHGLLLLAAERTAQVLREPAPFVLQSALDDFYVKYELNVYAASSDNMPLLYSELHQNIQDAFNEFGVQIMSPHYVADPVSAKIVPREHWRQPPARNPESSDKPSPN
jgi:small-conductance mechanosensitive channel